MFTTYHSDQQLASTPVTCSGTQRRLLDPDDQHDDPCRICASWPCAWYAPNAGCTAHSFNKRITEVGPRTQENGYDVVQGLIGFRGDFQLGDRNFAWDVFGSWGRAEGTSLQGGNVSRSQLQAALNNPAVYAAQRLRDVQSVRCGQPSAGLREGDRDQRDQRARLRADELRRQLDRRPVQPAGGRDEVRDRRRVSREQRRVPSGRVPGERRRGRLQRAASRSPASSTSRSRLPSCRFRSSRTCRSPSTSASTWAIATRSTTWPAAPMRTRPRCEWNPIRSLKLRGGYNRSIRAPNIQELFLPVQENFPAATDPCPTRARSARRAVRQRLRSKRCACSRASRQAIAGQLQPAFTADQVVRRRRHRP